MLYELSMPFPHAYDASLLLLPSSWLGGGREEEGREEGREGEEKRVGAGGRILWGCTCLAT